MDRSPKSPMKRIQVPVVYHIQYVTESEIWDEKKRLAKLTARVPECASEYEDKVTKRVCFADSIDRCLAALEACETQRYNVYIAKDKTEFYKPWLYQVPDSGLNHEFWSLEDTDVIYIGTIQVTGYTSRFWQILSYTGNTQHILREEYEWRVLNWNGKYDKAEDLLKCYENGYVEEWIAKHYNWRSNIGELDYVNCCERSNIPIKRKLIFGKLDENGKYIRKSYPYGVNDLWKETKND